MLKLQRCKVKTVIDSRVVASTGIGTSIPLSELEAEGPDNMNGRLSDIPLQKHP
jgi:hypothetical protein